MRLMRRSRTRAPSLLETQIHRGLAHLLLDRPVRLQHGELTFVLFLSISYIIEEPEAGYSAMISLWITLWCPSRIMVQSLKIKLV